MVSGDGYVLVDIIDYSVEFIVVILGLDDVSVVYIYIGCIGINGDVLVVFE